MNPPMTWARVWRIIRRVKEQSMPLTPGTLAYLQHEIYRMDRYQVARFYLECSDTLEAY